MTSADHPWTLAEVAICRKWSALPVSRGYVANRAQHAATACDEMLWVALGRSDAEAMAARNEDIAEGRA